jgi:hypothetical protein
MPAAPAKKTTWRTDLVLALIAALVALAVNAATGFRALGDAGGDNDSLLRLVEVRDLIAGQGWFDLHQYRMGPQGGFVMHWSRLVDAPIAVIILVASAVTGSMALAETIAQILWPALTYALTLFFLVRAASRFGGEIAALPAVVIGAAALYFIGIFEPGALDHHNVQLMLASASLWLLLEAPSQKGAALCCGICAALMIAVGMETAPYVAVLGLAVAAFFAFGGPAEKRIARGFGLGFAGISALAFIATIPPPAWGQAQCDAFSVAQFALAAVAGAGLAVIASADAANGTFRRRVVSLGLLAAALAALTLLAFPQCLAAPYGNVDPRLRALWLDHISEMQSVFELAAKDPASVVGRYVTPLVAIALMAVRFQRGAWRRQDSAVAALLVAAFLVSAWQVRGSTFSIAFAVVPLSAWVGAWRERANAEPAAHGVALKMAAVWLASVNATWIGAAAAASVAIEGGTEPGVAAAHAGVCEKRADFADLAAQRATTVLAISNLGSPILAYSEHRAIAGPYHRNTAGNLMVVEAFMGSSDAAKAVVERQHVGIVALCRASPEGAILVENAPQGFLAGLMRGAVPAWLEPIAETSGKPVELYRVRHAG